MPHQHGTSLIFLAYCILQYARLTYQATFAALTHFSQDKNLSNGTTLCTEMPTFLISTYSQSPRINIEKNNRKAESFEFIGRLIVRYQGFQMRKWLSSLCWHGSFANHQSCGTNATGAGVIKRGREISAVHTKHGSALIRLANQNRFVISQLTVLEILLSRFNLTFSGDFF